MAGLFKSGFFANLGRSSNAESGNGRSSMSRESPNTTMFAPTLNFILEEAVRRRNLKLRELIVEVQMDGYNDLEKVVDVLYSASEQLVGQITVNSTDSALNKGGSATNSDGQQLTVLNPVHSSISSAQLVTSSSIATSSKLLQLLVVDISKMCARSLMPHSKFDNAIQIVWKAFVLSEWGSAGPNSGGSGADREHGPDSHSTHPHTTGGAQLAASYEEMQQRMVQAAIGLLNVVSVGGSQIQSALSLVFQIALQSKSTVVVAAASAAITQTSQTLLRCLLHDGNSGAVPQATKLTSIGSSPSPNHPSVKEETVDVMNDSPSSPLKDNVGLAEAAATDTTDKLSPQSPTLVGGGDSFLAPTGSSSLFQGGTSSYRVPSVAGKHLNAVLFFKDVCVMIGGALKPKWVKLVNPITTVESSPTIAIQMMLLDSLSDLFFEATKHSSATTASDFSTADNNGGRGAGSSILGGAPNALSAALIHSSVSFTDSRAARSLSPLFSQCLNEDFVALVLNCDPQLTTTSVEKFSKLQSLAVSAICRFHMHMFHTVTAIVNKHCMVIEECVSEADSAKWPLSVIITAWTRVLGDFNVVHSLLSLSREKLGVAVAGGAQHAASPDGYVDSSGAGNTVTFFPVTPPRKDTKPIGEGKRKLSIATNALAVMDSLQMEEQLEGADTVTDEAERSDLRLHSPIVGLIIAVARVLDADARGHINTDVAFEFIGVIAQSLSRICETTCVVHGGVWPLEDAGASLLRRVLALLCSPISKCVQHGLQEVLVKWRVRQVTKVRTALRNANMAHPHASTSVVGPAALANGGGGLHSEDSFLDVGIEGAAEIESVEAFQSLLRCASHMIRSACVASLPKHRHGYLALLSDLIIAESPTWLSLSSLSTSGLLASPVVVGVTSPSNTEGSASNLQNSSNSTTHRASISVNSISLPKPVTISSASGAAQPQQVSPFQQQQQQSQHSIQRFHTTPFTLLFQVFNTITTLSGGVGHLFCSSWPLVCRVFVQASLCKTYIASEVERCESTGTHNKDIAHFIFTQTLQNDMNGVVLNIEEIFRGVLASSPIANNSPTISAADSSKAAPPTFKPFHADPKLSSQQSSSSSGGESDNALALCLCFTRIVLEHAADAAELVGESHCDLLPYVQELAAVCTSTRAAGSPPRGGATGPLTASNSIVLPTTLPDPLRHLVLAQLRQLIEVARKCIINVLTCSQAAMKLTAPGREVASQPDLSNTVFSTVWDECLVPLVLNPLCLARFSPPGAEQNLATGNTNSNHINHSAASPKSPLMLPFISSPTMTYAQYLNPNPDLKDKSHFSTPNLQPQGRPSQGLRAATTTGLYSPCIPEATLIDAAILTKTDLTFESLFTQYLALLIPDSSLLEILVGHFLGNNTSPSGKPINTVNLSAARRPTIPLSITKDLQEEQHCAAYTSEIRKRSLELIHDLYSGASVLLVPRPGCIDTSAAAHIASSTAARTNFTQLEITMANALVQHASQRSQAILKQIHRLLSGSAAEGLQQKEWVQLLAILSDASGGVPLNEHLYDESSGVDNLNSTSGRCAFEKQPMTDQDRWNFIHTRKGSSHWPLKNINGYAKTLVASATPTPNNTLTIGKTLDTPTAFAFSQSEDALLAFRVVDSVQHNSITSLKSYEALEGMIRCIGSFIVQSAHEKLSINLTAAQMMWALADYLATLQQELKVSNKGSNGFGGNASLSGATHIVKHGRTDSGYNFNGSFGSDSTGAGAATTGGSTTGIHHQRQVSNGFGNIVGGAKGLSSAEVSQLWISVADQLLRGCLDHRAEVRQSSIKSFFSVLTTHGKSSMQPAAWNVCCWRVVRSLIAAASSTTKEGLISQIRTIHLAPLPSDAYGESSSAINLHSQAPGAAYTSALCEASLGSLYDQLSTDHKSLGELRISLLDSCSRVLRLFGTFLLTPLPLVVTPQHNRFASGMNYGSGTQFPPTTDSHTGTQNNSLSVSPSNNPNPFSQRSNGGASPLPPLPGILQPSAVSQSAHFPVSDLRGFIGHLLRFAGNCITSTPLATQNSNAPIPASEDVVAACVRTIISLFGDFWARHQHLYTSSQINNASISGKRDPADHTTVSDNNNSGMVVTGTGGPFLLGSADVGDCWGALTAAVSFQSVSPATLTTIIEGLSDVLSVAEERCQNLSDVNNAVHTQLQPSAGYNISAPTSAPTPVDHSQQLPPYSAYYSILEAILRSPSISEGYFFPCKPQKAVLIALLVRMGVPNLEAENGDDGGGSPLKVSQREGSRETDAFAQTTSTSKSSAQLSSHVQKSLNIVFESFPSLEQDAEAVTVVLDAFNLSTAGTVAAAKAIDKVKLKACFPAGSHHIGFPTYLLSLLTDNLIPFLLSAEVGDKISRKLKEWTLTTSVRAAGGMLLSQVCIAACCQQGKLGSIFGINAEAAAKTADRVSELVFLAKKFDSEIVKKDSQPSLGSSSSGLQPSQQPPNSLLQSISSALAETLAFAASQLDKCSSSFEGPHGALACEPIIVLIKLLKDCQQNQTSVATATSALSALSSLHQRGLRPIATAAVEALGTKTQTAGHSPAATSTPTQNDETRQEHKCVSQPQLPTGFEDNHHLDSVLLCRLGSVAQRYVTAASSPSTAESERDREDLSSLLVDSLTSATATIINQAKKSQLTAHQHPKETFGEWGKYLLQLIVVGDGTIRTALAAFLEALWA